VSAGRYQEIVSTTVVYPDKYSGEVCLGNQVKVSIKVRIDLEDPDGRRKSGSRPAFSKIRNRVLT
jgi:hypothetical protein